jgi:hypothetical protein
MVDINEPILKAEHAHSLGNRQLLAHGGKCGCFHCFKTFDASEITHWGGRDGNTALCPFCHYDTVLSSNVDSIDPGFLGRMQAHWFGGKGIPFDLNAELATQNKPKAAE